MTVIERQPAAREGPAMLEGSPSAPHWASRLLVPEMWATVAIVVIWLAVLFDGVFGSNIYTSEGAGTNSTRIPSVVAVALFAFLATAALAKYAFGGRGERST